jgi:Mg2+ and Co2+ transporter CorA
LALSKSVYELKNLLGYFKTDELKKILLDDFTFAFKEEKEYDNGLYYTRGRSFWFENKNDPNKRFFIDLSLVKSLHEVQYNNEPADINVRLDLLGNYARSSFDGWETKAILHGKTEKLKPLFDKINEYFENIKEAIHKDPTIRLSNLFSDNPPVNFTNRLDDRLKQIEEPLNVSVKANKKTYHLDTKFYTEHFQYFEPTKKRYAGTIPRSMPFILKSGERTM